jgi:hypothetical protein
MSDVQLAQTIGRWLTTTGRWMPGMLCIWPNGNEWRVAQVNGVDGKHDAPCYPSGGWGDDYPDRTTGHPAIEDPATWGALLAILVEAQPKARIRFAPGYTEISYPAEWRKPWHGHSSPGSPGFAIAYGLIAAYDIESTP